MGRKKVSKCCQEHQEMVKKVRETAQTNSGIIYLDYDERKHLLEWLENNSEEISKCSNCGVLVQKMIDSHYDIPSSALPKNLNKKNNG